MLYMLSTHAWLGIEVGISSSAVRGSNATGREKRLLLSRNGTYKPMNKTRQNIHPALRKEGINIPFSGRCRSLWEVGYTLTFAR